MPVPPPLSDRVNAKDPQQVLKRLVDRVRSNPAITLHLSSRVTATSGFMVEFDNRHLWMKLDGIYTRGFTTTAFATAHALDVSDHYAPWAQVHAAP